MNNYFKNEGAMVAFALNELEGKSKMKVLGVSYSTMAGKKRLKAWYEYKKEALIQGGFESELPKLDSYARELGL